MYNEELKKLNISAKAYELTLKLESELREIFCGIEETECINQAKVLNAFQQNRVAAYCFMPTTGYGYDDLGRDTLDKVFADALGAEAAVVSPHIVSGTHAIFLALSGLLGINESMLSVSGHPYDTLTEAIGIENPAAGSLKEYGIEYSEIELNDDASFNIPEIKKRLAETKPRIVYVQRSRGYAWREAITLDNMKSAFDAVKRVSPDSIIVVDNCYGEFTDTAEPLAAGADIIAGSLIKNIGGGLAPTGGYYAGKREYVDRISNRLTVPGIGRETGSYFGSYLPFYQGLFLAPHTVAQSLKSAALFAKAFEFSGLPSMPESIAKRSDIVQAVCFGDKERLIKFCQGIQAVSPVDGFVIPEPWAMPGYNDEVIMAAGTFVQGASAELTADAPVCKPYIAYVQGALTYSHGKIAVMRFLSDTLK